MEKTKIIIKNAYTNNLKNIDIEIPKHRLVVFSGLLRISTYLKNHIN